MDGSVQPAPRRRGRAAASIRSGVVTDRALRGASVMKRNGFAWIRTILIGVLAFVVILLAIVIISVLVICILLPAFSAFTVWQFLVERVFRFRLRCAGRIMRWDAARQYLKDGGTLIVEIPANGGAVDRLWLLRDRLGKLDPLAPWVAFRQL